jgi:serine/threonine-protein kinase
MTQPAPQELFAGKFRLLKMLGRGAMGEVWLAVEEGPRNFRRQVAIKRLIASEGMSDFARESFVAEAQVIARLDHPNIVRLIELGESDDRGLYLALDFIDGSALDRIIRKGGPMSTAAVALIGREVARALDAVHCMCDHDGRNLGVVHRDVSPANILIGRDGRVRLSDFGVARITGLGGEKTETGVFKGKLPYMPPEQALGQPFDGRADVFSLGITLVEGLIGGRLRKAETQGQLIAMIATEQAPRVREVMPEAHPGLAAALDAATHFDANQRLASAGQLAHAMQDVLHSLGPQAEAQAVAELRERVAQVAGGATQQASKQPWSMAISGENPAYGSQPSYQSGNVSGGYRSAVSAGGVSGGYAPGMSGSQPAHQQPITGRHHVPPSYGRLGQPPSVPPGASQTQPSVTRVASYTEASSAPRSSGGSRAWIFTVAAALGIGVAVGAAWVFAPRIGPSASAGPGTDAPSATPTATADPQGSAAPESTAQPQSSAAAQPSASTSAEALASAAPSSTAPTRVPTNGRPRPTATATEEPVDANAGPGSLVVVVNPWGNVSVGGRSYGMTPLPPISLPPGTHMVSVTNPELGASRSASVKIVGGKASTVRFDLKKSD